MYLAKLLTLIYKIVYLSAKIPQVIVKSIYPDFNRHFTLRLIIVKLSAPL